jgi:hypothetical protein
MIGARLGVPRGANEVAAVLADIHFARAGAKASTCASSYASKQAIGAGHRAHGRFHPQREHPQGRLS